ncbi:hypothetical protein ET495_10345 [Xylanimonas allomyrinae]|uniref:LPXTG cell wall anchor domain-containing protein n=1 Tax=Xylanimonas allomyrinae TaxID=2509459 RepID=A0A4V0YEB0_9MICO|nr:hypothetical protein [Xylanimonas allomyrinae]QAY63581.1 hypothetical protein ET495_10345 [Xylanimonas allomyrinae]
MPSAGNTLVAGQATSLYVGTDRVGDLVDVWMFSTPRFIGRFPVNADGTVNLTLPADLVGSHRVVVTEMAAAGEVGAVLAWSHVTIEAPAAPGPNADKPAAGNQVPRAATGYAEGGIAPAVVALLGLGVATAGVLTVRRRAAQR